MNPMQILAMMRQGGNPQQILINMLESQAGSNPVMLNILNLAKQGKTSEIEAIARNIVKEQGGDFDKEFTDFKHKLGL